MVKHPTQIRRDFKEAYKNRGPERLAAVRRCWEDLKAYELSLARDSNKGSFFDVNEMRDLISEVQASLNRLEAGGRRRKKENVNAR